MKNPGANKGTPTKPMQATFGDSQTDAVDAPADYRMVNPANQHAYRARGVEANTNESKGREFSESELWRLSNPLDKNSLTEVQREPGTVA